MLWPAGRLTRAAPDGGWPGFLTLLRAAVAGVRDGSPSDHPARLALHTDRIGDPSGTHAFFDRITAAVMTSAAVRPARPVARLTSDQARRLALAAQGFTRPRPAGPLPADRRRLRWLFERVGVLQIDSVNVLSRSHYLPGWSRLGGYPRASLDDYAHRDRRVYEYWAHEASFVPVAWEPLLRWRAAQAIDGDGMWKGLAQFGVTSADYIAKVLAEVTAAGPLTVSQLTEPGRSCGSWWGWGEGKRAMEFLLWSGQVCAAGRRANFERLYDLPDRVLPAAVRALPTPEPADAHRELLLHAADRLGVALAPDLRDYFRLPAAAVKPRLAELVEAVTGSSAGST